MKPTRTGAAHANDYDLMIIGGGIHGTTLSRIFVATGAIAPERLAVIDPHETACADWFRTTEATGMRYLRSPGAHGVDGSFVSIRRFARESGYGEEHFIPPYGRPSLLLFNDHLRSLLSREDLERYRLQTTASKLSLRRDSILVETPRGGVSANRVVLAIGSEGGSHTPDVLSDVAGAVHIFDPEFDRGVLRGARRPLIVGGGISGAQAALGALEAGGAPRIASLHPIRVSQFDSNPCYIGPACLTRFEAEPDPTERGRIIAAERNPGSIPPDVADPLRNAVSRGDIELVVVHEPYSIQELVGDRDLVVAATGFRGTPLPDGLIGRTAEEAALPTDREGRPVLDRALRWHERVFVAGRAGELGIGPVAPNIIGAHLAARRIVPFLKELSLDAVVPWRPLRGL